MHQMFTPKANVFQKTPISIYRLWPHCCRTVGTALNGHRWCLRTSGATSTPSRTMCLWCRAESKARLCCLSPQAPREWSRLPWRQTKGKQTHEAERFTSMHHLSHGCIQKKRFCLWNFTGGREWIRASSTPWSQRWLSGAIRSAPSWRKTPLRLCWKAKTPHHTRSCSSGRTGQHLLLLQTLNIHRQRLRSAGSGVVMVWK